MKYDGVIFDFDGVLIDSGFDSFEWAHQVRRKEVQKRDWDVDLTGFEQGIFQPHHSEDIKPLMDEKNTSWRQLRILEEAVAERKIEMVENNKMHLFQDTETVLKTLDLPKAVVSNAYHDALDRMVQHFGIHKHLEFWTAPKLSQIEKYRETMKPEPKLLEEAMEHIGAENPVMVGDQIGDVLAAHRAGIDSIYINRDGEKIEKADYEVKTLSEVKEIIRD